MSRTADRRARAAGGLSGPVRSGSGARALAARVRPGDLAVIDQMDLDRAAAEALAAARPAAVLNASRSLSGRYPALGPQVLVDAGVPLVDDLGPDVLGVPEGHVLRLDGGAVYDGESLVAEGEVQTAQSVAEATAAARAGLATQLESFAANAIGHLRTEGPLMIDGEGLPQLRTVVDGRPVLVVVPGEQAARDVAALRPFVRERRPVLIGVDGGADVLLGARLEPDLVVGDLELVSDRALTGGAEVVLRVRRDGQAPAGARLERLGVRSATTVAGGTPTDVALLLAAARGAQVVVLAGSRTGLIDLLDAGREAMAGTVLTRLHVGAALLDARAVAQLYRHRISTAQLALLLVGGLLALAVALAVTPAGQDLYAALGDRLANLARWAARLFGGTTT